MSDCSVNAWRKPSWGDTRWHEPTHADPRRGIHGRVAWEDGSECELHYARFVNGSERRADFVEIDGERFAPERTCTMELTFEGDPCSDYRCGACGKVQAVCNALPMTVPRWHCVRCGARCVRRVDVEGREMPLHGGLEGI